MIPAYNEERRIAHVLCALRQTEGLAQITVVDDASSDGTCDVVRAYCERDPRIHLLRLPANLGKGGAMVAGANASASDLIVFLDADLIGLRPEHVSALIEPVQKGLCSMAVGLFTAGGWLTDWCHRVAPFLSGERCLKWSLFRSDPDLATAGLAVEFSLSLHAWRNRYRVVSVPWHGVTHVWRTEKVGRLQGWVSIGRMYGDAMRCLAARLTR